MRVFIISSDDWKPYTVKSLHVMCDLVQNAGTPSEAN